MAEEDTTNPPETEPPAPAPPRPDDHAECKGMIHGLTERIEEVENTLRTVLSVKTDSTPVRTPWTHRKVFK